ncbi:MULTISPECIES: carotenoid oxygenase family protein [Francisella]|uniref:Uncharacterized protein n=1 Tax=Francisella opportunistica TaxID=2016517 RepID=A0A345JS26_9GAMM|nr:MULTISPECIES: carotenoid oxygenase family protein [Francisella]APC91882.1 15,15' beta carotene dioxygenase [Francisella sp. MA067296]AXH30122.1 hypothetical protein CGC43_05770 [Francisella opportunistica]AXH31765.1 hypothetical protein CGC44_05755 [Francisella opportunistica]AXH33412.1 hypothetical protein CGC45_05765 [Francisella opportunistica]
MSKLNLAFANVAEEFSQHLLKPQVSNLPDWFGGQILRVGPAKFEYGKVKLNHWFDGLAMLYSFESSKKDIYFSNKYLRSEQYFAANNGRMKYDEFGTMLPSKITSIIKTILGFKVEKPSCNVNIFSLSNRLLAATEATTLIEFSSNNLETLKEFRFNDKLKGQFSCAHPQLDPITQEQFNFVVDISRNCKYIIYKISKNSTKREKLYQFSDKQFIYNHTLFVTDNYVVLYLGPLRANPLEFLTKPIAEVISYDKNASCKFLLLNRNSLKATFIQAPTMVFLHSVNAFEVDNQIHLDFIEYTDSFDPYKKFYFKNIKTNDCKLKTQLVRTTIDISNAEISKRVVADYNVEFPRINQSFLMKSYRYVYLANRETEADFFNSIIKFDITDGSIDRYSFGDDHFVSEPIFIANPQAQSEDDGLIFVNVIDIQMQLSYIAYLNANDLTLVYKAYLPILIPPALHGIYLK